MKTIRKILLPVVPRKDLGEILTFADDFAQKCGAGLYLVNVLEPVPSLLSGEGTPAFWKDISEKGQKKVRETLQKMTAGLESLRSLEIMVGYPLTKILKSADRHGVDLILVSPREKDALEKFVVGSVAENLSREAKQAVCVLKGKPKAFRRILVALDGSKASAEVLPLAGFLAKICKARITAVSFVPQPDINATALIFGTAGILQKMHRKALAHRKRWMESVLRGHRISAEVRVESGDPRRGLPRLADGLPADLIVMTTRGATGLKSILLGSVARKVLHRSSRSVLLLKPRS